MPNNSTITLMGPAAHETIPSSLQYSDNVSRFATKPEYIVSALKENCFSPRYSREDFSVLGAPGLNKLAIAMVCFCDIPHDRLHHHASDSGYGKYGIELTKEWAVSNSLQPVHYLNRLSRYCDDLRDAFLCAKRLLNGGNEDIETLRSFVVTSLLFTKPLYEGEECRQDECEWRYVPRELEKGMPVLFPSSKTGKELEAESNSLLRDPASHLPFSDEDVVCLLAANANAAESLIEEIRQSTMTDERKELFERKMRILERQ